MPHLKERETGYDLLRLFAMVAVVATHVLMVYRVPGAPPSAVSLIDSLLHFAVPVFFFVSGALVWGRYTGTSTSEHGSFLRRRAATVGAPYLAWSALYLTIAGIRGNWIYWVAHTPLLVLTGRSWYHLYFVPVLLLFYLLTRIAAPIVRRWPELTVAAALLAGLTLRQPTTVLATRLGGPMLVTFAVVALTHVSNMTLGAWFARRRDTVLPFLRLWWPALLIPGVALLTWNALGTNAVPDMRWLAATVVPTGMTLVVLGLTGIAFRIRLAPQHAVRTAKFASYSFGVYLLHPALVLVWRTGVTAVGGSPWWGSAWFAVLSVAGITAGSLALSALLAGNPSTAWLIGHAPRSRTRHPAAALGPAPAPSDI